jgi:hypothetical protein
VEEFMKDLDKKSDDELIALSEGKLPGPITSYGKSTITVEDVMIAAKTELHRRKKKEGKKNLSIQIWILSAAGISVIIAALTLVVVLLQFCQQPTRISHETQQKYYNNPPR